jgi:hypothetical protein
VDDVVDDPDLLEAFRNQGLLIPAATTAIVRFQNEQRQKAKASTGKQQVGSGELKGGSRARRILKNDFWGWALPIAGAPLIQEAKTEQLLQAQEVLAELSRGSMYQSKLCGLAAEAKSKGEELTYDVLKRLSRKARQRKVVV